MDATTQETTQATTQATTSSAVADKPWYSELFQSDGALNAKAFERAPDDLKPASSVVSKYKTVDDLLRGMHHLNNLVGKKGLEPLPDNAPEAIKAERDALMRRLNQVPDKPEHYGLAKKPDNIPDDQWDNEWMQQMEKFAWEHKLPPSTVKAFMESESKYVEQQKLKFQAMQDAHWKQQDAAIKDLAIKENSTPEKVNDLAARAAKQLGIPPEHPSFKESVVRTALYNIAKQMGEGKLIGESSNASDFKDFGQMANDIVHNKSNPKNAIYWSENHPMKNQVRKEVEQYWTRAHEKKK